MAGATVCPAGSGKGKDAASAIAQAQGPESLAFARSAGQQNELVERACRGAHPRSCFRVLDCGSNQNAPWMKSRPGPAVFYRGRLSGNLRFSGPEAIGMGQ